VSRRTSFAWAFSEQSLQQLIQLAAAIVIARLLAPDEMGIYALAVSAAALLTALRDFGVGNYLIREADLTMEKVRSAFGAMLVVSWGLGLVLVLGRDAIADLYGRPEIADVMGLLSLSFFVAPFGQPATALLTREMRFRELHGIGLVAVSVGSALSVSLAFAGYSYYSLAWGLLTTMSLKAVLPMFVYRRYALMWPSFTHWRDITHFGGLLSLTSLFGAANNEGMRFVLGWFTSPASLAQFHRAGQVPTLFRQGIFAPVARVLTPAWSEDIRNGRPIKTSAENLVALNTVLVWPVFLSLSFVAVPFITLVFGPQWEEAGQIFAWVLLSQGVVAALPQPEQVLVPFGLVGRAFAIRSSAAVVSLMTAIYGASLGLEAFAISRVVSASFLTVIVFLAIRRLIDFHPGRYALRYLRSAGVAVLAALPAAAFHFSGQESMGLFELAALVAACGVLWVIGVFITRHFVWGELLLVARKGLASLG
jgi:O-antigen/teichoic acid export membrane protein